MNIIFPLLLLQIVKLTCTLDFDLKCIDVAHSIGVQNVVLPFFCLQEPIFNVLVIFFVLNLGVYVCLVMSLLILSFYLS